MSGLICLAVNDETMREKDRALDPVLPLLNPGPAYGPKARMWQGIPSLARSRGGRLFCAFYTGGQDEGPDNHVVILMSRDNGHSWSPPILAVDPPGQVRAFDACLWVDPRGRLCLFWAQSYGGFDGRAGCWLSICRDPDGAMIDWREPRRIADGVMLNKPTVAASGDWLLPIALWNALDPSFNPQAGPRLSNIYASSDNGVSFHYRGGADVPGRYYDEPMLVEKQDGALWMLVRIEGGIGESLSRDGGRTWSPGRRTALWGPNARFFIRRLRSGRLLLCNHLFSGRTSPDSHPAFNLRSHLAVWLSEDDGKTWGTPFVIDEREGVSYPDGDEGDDGLLYLTYDHNRFTDKEILLAVITEEDILQGRLVSPHSRLKVLVDKAL